MINLLPPDIKQTYRYARLNQRLSLWSVAFLLAIVGTAGLTFTGINIMDRSSKTYQREVAETQAELKRQNIDGVEKQVGEISGNLKLMVQVLSKEILFSKLLTRLGNATPANVVLTDLSISQTEQAIDLKAQARDYNGATQLQANLADEANQIFSKADIVNITCNPTAGATGINAQYPCTTSIRALLTENSPFLFISNDPVKPAKKAAP